MCRIVIHMDLIVQHTWMVRTAGVDLLEELGCLRLALKTLRTFLDCPQNGKAVEKLGLIVRKAGISCSHGVPVAFVPRSFRSCASILEQSGDRVEIELLSRRHFLRRKSLLHQTPCSRLVRGRRRVPEGKLRYGSVLVSCCCHRLKYGFQAPDKEFHFAAAGSFARNLPHGLPPVQLRPSVNETPAIGVETSELFLDFEKCARVAHGGLDFHAVANNRRI